MQEEQVAGVIGNISSYHICGYMKVGAKIAAIVDIDVKLAESLAEKYGIEKIFEHYEDMLNECPEINLLSNCLLSVF